MIGGTSLLTMLYEARSLGVFNSDAYLACLNAPTEWSNHIQPYFLNFIRAACQTQVSTGRGVGGALLTARVDFTDGGKDTFGVCAALYCFRLIWLSKSSSLTHIFFGALHATPFFPIVEPLD